MLQKGMDHIYSKLQNMSVKGFGFSTQNLEDFFYKFESSTL